VLGSPFHVGHIECDLELLRNYLVEFLLDLGVETEVLLQSKNSCPAGMLYQSVDYSDRLLVIKSHCLYAFGKPRWSGVLTLNFTVSVGMERAPHHEVIANVDFPDIDYYENFLTIATVDRNTYLIPPSTNDQCVLWVDFLLDRLAMEFDDKYKYIHSIKSMIKYLPRDYEIDQPQPTFSAIQMLYDGYNGNYPTVKTLQEKILKYKLKVELITTGNSLTQHVMLRICRKNALPKVYFTDTDRRSLKACIPAEYFQPVLTQCLNLVGVTLLEPGVAKLKLFNAVWKNLIKFRDTNIKGFSLSKDLGFMQVVVTEDFSLDVLDHVGFCFDGNWVPNRPGFRPMEDSQFAGYTKGLSLDESIVSMAPSRSWEVLLDAELYSELSGLSIRQCYSVDSRKLGYDRIMYLIHNIALIPNQLIPTVSVDIEAFFDSLDFLLPTVVVPQVEEEKVDELALPLLVRVDSVVQLEEAEIQAPLARLPINGPVMPMREQDVSDSLSGLSEIPTRGNSISFIARERSVDDRVRHVVDFQDFYIPPHRRNPPPIVPNVEERKEELAPIDPRRTILINFPARYERLVETFNTILTFTRPRNAAADFQPVFRAARLAMMYYYIEPEGPIAGIVRPEVDYRGPSATFWRRHVDIDPRGPRLSEFLAPSVGFHITVLCPKTPASYSLFNSEGVCKRLNNGVISLRLNGMRESLDIPLWPVSNFMPDYMSGGECYRTHSYARIGEDVFLAFVEVSLNDVILPPFELRTALQNHLGRLVGIQASDRLYKAEVELIKQWFTTGINSARYQERKDVAHGIISNYVGAVRGYDDRRGDSDMISFRSLVLMAAEELGQNMNVIVGASDQAVRSEPGMQLSHMLDGGFEQLAVASTLHNEAANTGYLWYHCKRLFYKISQCCVYREASKTLARPIVDANQGRVLPYYGARTRAAHEALLLRISQRVNTDPTVNHPTPYPLLASAGMKEAIIVPQTERQKSQLSTLLEPAIQAELSGKGEWTKFRLNLRRNFEYESRVLKAEKLNSNPQVYFYPKKPTRCPDTTYNDFMWALLARQLLPQTIISRPDLLLEVKKTTEIILNQSNGGYEVRTEAEWLNSVPSENKKRYVNGIRMLELYGRMSKLVGFFVKDTEGQLTDFDKLKPRVIVNPSDGVKGIGSYMAGEVMRSMKARLKYAVRTAMSPSALRFQVSKALSRCSKPIFFMQDGARHDAHQSLDLLKVTDFLFMPREIRRLGPAMGFSPHVMRECLEMAVSPHIKFNVKLSSRRYGPRQLGVNMLKGKFIGTVYSGHPFRTTLGNSVRISLVLLTICRLAGIPTVHIEGYGATIFQSGDDTMVIMDEEYAPAFEATRRLFYTDTPYQPSGIGLIASDVKYSKTTFDFLGKQGHYLNGEVEMWRPIGKVNTMAWFYSGYEYPFDVSLNMRKQMECYERDVYRVHESFYPKGEPKKFIPLMRLQEFDGDEKMIQFNSLKEELCRAEDPLGFCSVKRLERKETKLSNVRSYQSSSKRFKEIQWGCLEAIPEEQED
jgi:hypothetical protein